MVSVIAQLTIHDRRRYDRYAAGFLAVLRKLSGRDQDPITPRPHELDSRVMAIGSAMLLANISQV
jgi:hypothetical protein